MPAPVPLLVRPLRLVVVLRAMLSQPERRLLSMPVRTLPGHPRGTIPGFGLAAAGPIIPIGIGTGLIGPIGIPAGEHGRGAGIAAGRVDSPYIEAAFGRLRSLGDGAR